MYWHGQQAYRGPWRIMIPSKLSVFLIFFFALRIYSPSYTQGWLFAIPCRSARISLLLKFAIVRSGESGQWCFQVFFIVSVVVVCISSLVVRFTLSGFFFSKVSLTRKSARIRSPSYRRRTTLTLPEIVSVRIFLLPSCYVLTFKCFFQGCCIYIHY